MAGALPPEASDFAGSPAVSSCLAVALPAACCTTAPGSVACGVAAASVLPVLASSLVDAPLSVAPPAAFDVVFAAAGLTAAIAAAIAWSACYVGSVGAAA